MRVTFMATNDMCVREEGEALVWSSYIKGYGLDDLDNAAYFLKKENIISLWDFPEEDEDKLGRTYTTYYIAPDPEHFGWDNKGEWVSDIKRFLKLFNKYINNPELNDLVNANSAFTTFQDLANAKGDYRPSLDVANPDLMRLADCYDEFQKGRYDQRRAYRH